jgi:RNA polymerase sigma-70 factor (ECF subfamily)
MNPHTPPTAKLLLEHQGFLQGLARSLLQDEQRAEDVVQEAYAAALRKPPPSGVNLRAWLTGVTRNLALRARRSEGRLRRREQRAARPESLGATDDIAARVEIHRRLSNAVAALPEPGRTAIVRRYLDGLRPSQIAELEATSVRTIESRLRRARAHLRAQLDLDYSGKRGAWRAALLPLAGLDVTALGTTSAAGTSAAATASVAKAAGGLGLAVATGASIMSTKLAIGAAVLCVAGAFFAGRQFPAAAPSSSDDPAAARDATEGAAPELVGDTGPLIKRLQASVDSMKEENEKILAAKRVLEAELAAAREAGFVPEDEQPTAKAGGSTALFIPEKHKEVISGIEWPEAGEAAARMVPLLDQLATAFRKGELEGVESVGMEIFKWNQKLETLAVSAITAKVPGTTGNGAFTHPAVALNLIHAALTDAKLPLNDEQLERIREIGDDYMESDARRVAGYDEDVFALQKVIDECAIKDRMFAAVDEVLTAEQRDALHPEGVRNRLGIDLYSSGTIWYGVAQPVDFTVRDDLVEGLVQQYNSRTKLEEHQVALIRDAARIWAGGFSDDFLEASADPTAQASRKLSANGMLAGWQRLEQVRVAATRQLALNRMLYERAGDDSKTAARIKSDTRVFIPIKR